ncbi:MAG: hypothetical protein ACK5CL_10800, partial [Sphingomonadales bacterium]
PVYGFKFSDKIYGNSDFNKLIGYDHEKSNTLYTQFECLNKYYKVIRTDNRDDILWLTINRSTSGVYLKLVFRSNKIKKIDQYTHDKTDILYSKNDYVYFYRFFEKQNSLFLIASDKPVTANSINSESEQVTFGMMEVLDSDGKTLDAENIKRDQITKTLRRRDLLEGFKINHEFQWSNKNGDKIELYGLVPGFCGDVCKSCCKAPCICQKIIEWENGDRPTDIVSDFYNDSPFNF